MMPFSEGLIAKDFAGKIQDSLVSTIKLMREIMEAMKSTNEALKDTIHIWRRRALEAEREVNRLQELHLDIVAGLALLGRDLKTLVKSDLAVMQKAIQSSRAFLNKPN